MATVQVKLTKGMHALIDEEDLPKTQIPGIRWTAQKSVSRSGKVSYYATGFVYMHHLVLQVPRVDHKDHDGLNNTRLNLRAATSSQNSANTGKYTNKSYTSKYKGVCWVKGKKKWRANIFTGSRKAHIGYFEDEIEAARAYNAAALKAFGEFACLNEVA